MKKQRVELTTKDIDFLMRTLVYSLMILALLHAFKPYYGDTAAAPTSKEIAELSRKTTLIAPREVGDHLITSTRPTMLVLYASWCGYCKEVMPHIYELWKEGKINGDQMMVLSLDTQTNLLSDYLLTNNFNSMLGVPLMMKTGTGKTLRAVLRPTGSSHEGGIPYIGFFAPGGKLLQELPGVVQKHEIEAMLVLLK